MSKISVADFYYGAALSILFNKHASPALVEGDENRQVYDVTTDKAEHRIFLKYRANKQEIVTPDYNSWIFTISDNDKKEMLGYIKKGYNLLLGLICGIEGLFESEFVILDKDQIKELNNLNKKSISISRKKNEKSYRISVGGGRENSMQIRCSRFEELF